MMLLSPIRLIKIKTFIISRTDQNVVKLHILLILVLTAKAFWKKKFDTFDYIYSHYNAFIDPTIPLGNKSMGT